MNKILNAILIVGLTITPLSYVQGSSDKHGHGNHDHDAKENHGDHKTDDKDGHDSHGHGAKENHDDHKTDDKDAIRTHRSSK